jgi:hypothetical protein
MIPEIDLDGLSVGEEGETQNGLEFGFKGASVPTNDTDKLKAANISLKSSMLLGTEHAFEGKMKTKMVIMVTNKV